MVQHARMQKTKVSTSKFSNNDILRTEITSRGLCQSIYCQVTLLFAEIQRSLQWIFVVAF